jgi:hypothetical protein
MPLDLDWVMGANVNRSAVERRVESLPKRRSIKKNWQAACIIDEDVVRPQCRSRDRPLPHHTSISDVANERVGRRCEGLPKAARTIVYLVGYESWDH